MAQRLDPEIERKRARKRAARGEDPMQGASPTFRGSTGYEYTRGGNTPHHINKRDWDAMSQEERDSIGVSTFEDLKRINRGWRGGFQEGGANFENQSRIANILRGSNIQSESDLARALNSAGIFNAKDEGQALFRRLMGAFRGDIDPSGRYHRTGGQWADMGTSDLAKAGIPGAADYFGQGAGGGLSSVLAGLAGGGNNEQAYFDRLVNQGDWTLDPTSGQYFNDPDNDSSRRQWVDRNNLQVQGSGYRSVQDPSRGPQIDYSKIPAGQSIADYLKGSFASDQKMDDYWKRAAEATPYTPGTGGAPAAQPVATQPSPTFGAWGVTSAAPSAATQPRPQNAMMGQPRSNPPNINQPPQPQVGYSWQPSNTMPRRQPGSAPSFRYRYGAI